MPNILLVVPCYLPATRYGGPVRSIHALARGLAASGFGVRVMTTNADGPETLAVPLDQDVVIDGVTVRYHPVASPRSFFYSPALRDALPAAVAAADLVYCAWIYVYTTLAAGWECRRQGVPLIVSPRGMLDRDSVRRKGWLRKSAFISLFTRPLVRRAAAVHFTSPGERDQSALAVPAEKALVVPNGVDLRIEEVEPGPIDGLEIAPEKKVVLFLGRISYIKGLDQLIRAWPAVVQAEPLAHLVLAGPDDEGLYRTLAAQVERLGLQASVTYMGMANEAQKSFLLQRCTLLANPSYLESFGMAIVEAMACARPVVVTESVNIAPDIAEARAGLVTRSDPAEISRAIVQLLADPALAARMGAAARELVRSRYSLDRATAAMATAIHGVLQRSPRPSRPRSAAA